MHLTCQISHRDASFISEITKYANSASAKDSEARIEHLLRGMRTLKLRVYPEAELELAAELLESLAALFVNAHGQPLNSPTWTHSLSCFTRR